MPLHLQSIMNDDQNQEPFAYLLSMSAKALDSVFVSKDKYIHAALPAIDEISGKAFGKVVYTMKVDDEKQLVFLIDADIVLNNPNTAKLRFPYLRGGSSDANEYYDAESVEDKIHLQIETVNRHMVEEELLDTEKEVRASVFPFELTVYDDIEAYNRSIGFHTQVQISGTEYKVHGFSDKFMMPGGLFHDEKDNETYTFLLGTVTGLRNVKWRLDKQEICFVIAELDTAIGVIPAAMSRDVFDLSELAAGKVIAMNADIKVDFQP